MYFRTMLIFPTNIFPVLETERLILREFTLKDIEALYQIRTNPEVLKSIFKEPMKLMQESIDLVNKMRDDFENSAGINWAMTWKTSGEIVGVVGLWRMIREHYRAEVGYTLRPEYWNKGVVSEGLNAVMDWAFNQLNLHTIEANLDPNNKASERVLQKAGFIKEGYFKEDFYFRGKFYDTLTYGKVNPNKSTL